MKYLLLILTILSLAISTQGQVKCHIEGEIIDTTQGKTVILCPYNLDIRTSADFVKIKADAQGRFSCDVSNSEITLYKVFLEEQYLQGGWMEGKFLIENNATVRLCFDNEKWSIVSAGREQTMKIEMDKEIRRLFYPTYDSLSKLENSQERQAALGALNRKISEWEVSYYKEHPMIFPLFEIADQMKYLNSRHQESLQMKMELYHSAYETLHPELSVHNYIAIQEAGWLLQPGKPYIDYEARTVDGNLVKVSSLYKGKVALIDLWASWCGPCRRHSIDMIPIYEKYKDKGFTVVAIAHENELSAMTKAAQKDGYPWQSLIDLNDELHIWQKNGLGFSGGGMFLINRDGTIISTSTDVAELEPLIKKALNIE